MKKKKAIFISTASQVIVRFFTLALTLIAVKLITNYLGTSGTGDYNTVSTFLNFFIVIADLGLFSVAVREISKHPEDEKKILSNVFTIRVISAAIAVVVAIGIVFSTKFSPNVKYGTLVASGFVFFNLLSSMYDMIFQHRLKMQFSALAELIARVITLIALYLVIKNHGNFYFIVSTIALSGFLIFLFKRILSAQFSKFSLKYDRQISNWIFNLAWPLGIVFIVNNLFFKIDTLMVAWIKGSVAVGIYSTAYKVLEVIVFVGGYFASSLKPVLSKDIDNDKKGVAKIIEKSINIMLILALPITAISAAFPKEIILFISSPAFLSGSRALVLLSFTLPFIYLDTLLGEVLLANNSRKLLVRIAIVMLSFNFLTNLYFIPKYSFMGAAFTTFISEVLLFAINLYYTKKILPYKIDLEGVIKIILIASATWFFAVIIKDVTSLNFIFISLIALIINLLLLNFTGIFTIQTLREIKNSED